MSTEFTSRHKPSRKVELLSISLIHDPSVATHVTFEHFKGFLNRKLGPLGYKLKGSEYGKSWHMFVVPKGLISSISRELRSTDWKILADVSLDEKNNELYIQFDHYQNTKKLNAEKTELEREMAEFSKIWQKMLVTDRIPNKCKRIHMCLIDHK